MSGPEHEDPRPRDIDAERAVLGAMLLSGDAIEAVVPVVNIEDFYRPAHGDLFAVICELWEATQPTDPVSVAAVLTQRRQLMAMGGAPYLHTLISEVPTTANAAHWAEIVADRAARARLIDASMHLRQLATDAEDDTAAIQERARQAVETATLGRAVSDAEEGAWIGDAVDAHIDAWDEERTPGLSSPFTDLNMVIGGLHPGQLVIVAARPAVGKSIMASDWARHVSACGDSVLFVSLEMSRKDIIDRVIAAESKVRLADIHHQSMDHHDRYRANQVRSRLHKMSLRIEDRYTMSLARLRAVAREIKRSERGLNLLIIDYIQLLAPADPRVNRREQVDAFSRGLKSLAKELDIPVIALAQLNRGPEARPDRKPMMSDLRESGSLEQDADIVILLHRPDAYERDDPRAGEADLCVVKNRNGPTTTVTVAHQLHYARFGDIGPNNSFPRQSA